MSDERFNLKLVQLRQAIGLCHEKNLVEPTLMLLYSGIDICGWLANDDPNAKVRQSFVAWTDKYMEPQAKLRCSADDLYGARCGILHTLSADSDHNKKGKARQVAYAWGTGKAEVINEIWQQSGESKFAVAIHLDGLVKAWSEGVIKFSDDLDNDAAWAQRVYKRASQFFLDFGAGKDGELTRPKSVSSQ
jgi:hypothetical protein